ncbi:MAG: APC family permease, partial [Myxococcota bacterium]
MTPGRNDAEEHSPAEPRRLRRVLGIPGAVGLGLGSILGTGVFMSLALAADLVQEQVLLCVQGAALVALLNGLSSARLAAAHPVSGGTYEYGYRLLRPSLGFVAGGLFLLAKSASAASAALALGQYALAPFGLARWPIDVASALCVLAVLAWLVGRGVRPSQVANFVLVGFTVGVLLVLVVAALSPHLALPRHAAPVAALTTEPTTWLRATALLFVAFTGYGRIATLGEEVKDPARTIPRAILVSLLLTSLLYSGVASALLARLPFPSDEGLSVARPAPLVDVAATLPLPWLPPLVQLAAGTALLGVLLNLLLGLSRVVLAMARRRDLPRGLAHLDERGDSPRRAVMATAGLITVFISTGRIEFTWSFSAWCILGYYALTHLAALALPRQELRMPRALPLLGLLSTVVLGFSLDVAVLVPGTGAVA